MDHYAASVYLAMLEENLENARCAERELKEGMPALQRELDDAKQQVEVLMDENRNLRREIAFQRASRAKAESNVVDLETDLNVLVKSADAWALRSELCEQAIQSEKARRIAAEQELALLRKKSGYLTQTRGVEAKLVKPKQLLEEDQLNNKGSRLFSVFGAESWDLFANWRNGYSIV